ncbi:MAG: DUF378 domain-containing protein [Nanoarchaeota archaeon]
MAKASSFEWIAWVIVVIGGLNWGLVGFFDYNLVTSLLGSGTLATKIVYDVVGLAAVYGAYLLTTYMKKHK